jgi:hypothetical protein
MSVKKLFTNKDQSGRINYHTRTSDLDKANLAAISSIYANFPFLRKMYIHATAYKRKSKYNILKHLKKRKR